MINSSNAYEQNKAFTEHNVDAMLKALEEKLELEISIHRKLHGANLPLNSILKIMCDLLYVIWVVVYPRFRNLYVMCLALPILKNVILICA